MNCARAADEGGSGAGSSYESGSRTQTRAEARAGEVGGGGARTAGGRGRCSTLISSSTTGGQLSHWHRYSCRDTATATAVATTTKGGNSKRRKEKSKGNLTCLWTARVFGYAKGQNQHQHWRTTAKATLVAARCLICTRGSARGSCRRPLRQQLQVLLKMSMWQILKYLY